MLVEEYVIAGFASVTVASIVIMIASLSKYHKLIEQANESASLAKDVWESVSSRFSVVDSRIVDLMAKTEVLASRMSVVQAPNPVAVGISHANRIAPTTPTILVANTDGTETEVKVLQMLSTGAKNSAQIRQELGKSREHTARLMKALFDRGLVVRNDRHKPYVYEITEAGKSYLAS